MKTSLCMNNSKALVNSLHHRDYRLEEYINHNEDDTIRLANQFHKKKKLKIISNQLRFFLSHSNKSYGSHKNRSFKDESHKGSLDSLDGEEKKDVSKEDLEDGK